MAESTEANTNKKSSAIYWYVGMIILLTIVIIVGFTINNYIINKQFINNSEAISKSKQINNPLKTLKIDSTKIYKLKEADLQKFNDHIDYLSDKVEGEVKRTQENNQYDIDRINVLLAIGIGLLTIIGGLLPLVVNFFSREHLEKRMGDIEDDAKIIQLSSKEAMKQADTAKKDAIKANESVTAIEEKVLLANQSIEKINNDIKPLHKGLDEVKDAVKKVPYIDLLVFQNAVAKLTSTDALKLFMGDERIKWIAGYLENLTSAIDSFDEVTHSFEKYTSINLKYFQNVISELKFALFLGPIRRIPDGRSFQSKIDEVVLLLSNFEKLDTKDFKTQLKKVSSVITELKTIIESKII